MTIWRRALLKQAVAAMGLAFAATLAATAPSQAQMELKIMAPAGPGGGWDQTARSLQQAMVTGAIVKSAQVTNVTGAGGTIGLAQLVNNAKGDGSQVMVAGLVMVGAILTNKSPVTLEQTTPLARLTGEFEAVVVPTSSPLKTMADLVAALKADPGKVSWGGGSAGGTDHITVGLIAKAVGVDPTKINYIPFSGGGEALAAILGGQVTAGISGIGEFDAQVKAGRLRYLGVSSVKRIDGVNAPTFKESGVDVDIANWRGVFGPPGISDAQRKALIDALDKMAQGTSWKETLKAKGWDDLYLSGDGFATYVKAESARITETLKSIGLVK